MYKGLNDAYAHTFSYIIKRKHVGKEDPEETRDKEISGEPAASSLTENEFGFTFGHLPRLLFHTSSFSSPYNGAFTHLYTHRLAMRA